MTWCDAVLDEIVLMALREDLAGGDLTSEALIPAEQRAIAKAVAHTPCTVAGGEVFARAFYLVDRSLRVEALKRDGEQAEAGETLLEVEGSTRSILMGERTALNFLQRMSGIATLTRRYVDAIPSGTQLRIADTRKTTPGLRRLERVAVRAGGGFNHRNDLGAAVLIKDNHIVAAGSVKTAIERARAYAPHTSRIEIEVESLEALDAALEAGADVILLDNFADADLEAAVKRARGKACLEASGGITLPRIPRLASVGIDVVSVGALTHSAQAADIGLDIEILGPS